MNTALIVSLVAFLTMVGLIIAMVVRAKSKTYDVKGETVCEQQGRDKNGFVQGGNCGVWSYGDCFKGTVKSVSSDKSSVECEKASDHVEAGLLLLTPISFIVFLVSLVVGLIHMSRGR